ncbi:uncharacterized protein A1O5_04035 [Cladophialophora psammophila CBS 110553]|uniref:Xylanolytic transcriptional activator regulatory domain-containing protein n=1 Tax=Cladophialophora psammophila CBS 110553 TaxID=1182543 RepID=W9WXH0_9EURO|nr:uncharacterized protein A1O5_04035 [Cladophialophora psammophila CBS 110553]EXJ72887.1 hypothetical protein A1O5_04035 [Cladophialophora psammophila CBS 110553]
MSVTFSPGRRESKLPNSPLVQLMSEGPSKALIDRLISPSDPVLYDRSSGRLRPSCPMIAFHQFSELSPSIAAGNSREQDRRAERLLRELNPETHDHLLESFWSYYDPVMQVVDRKVFEEDRKSGCGLTYSGFLHICILAMGYRYADTKRADIQKLTLQNKESTLHREAKYLVEFEFEKPGGIPSVQALLILGQLESGCGRDAVGWMYAVGVAFRYAFDLGLNLDCSRLNLPERERKFREFVLRACTAFDKLWAIYLGRLTTIKSSDFRHHTYLDRPQEFQDEQPQADQDFEKNIDIQCFDALLDLLDITAKVVEYLYSRQSSLNHNAFVVISSLDADLKKWYSRLPRSLTWTPENIETAPLSYFHLHSQYHASLVLLHRPLALYEQTEFDSESDSDIIMNTISPVSRAVCIRHTFKMVHILSRQVQRFDPTRSPQAQLQHIGTAVAALISATAVSKDPQERMRLLKPLHTFAELARAISPTYMPAEMISDILDNLLKEPGWGYEPVSGLDQGEVVRDTSGKEIGLEDEFFKNPLFSPMKEVYGNSDSPAKVTEDFNFTLESNDTLEMLSSFEGRVGVTDQKALGSMSICLPPTSSQQVKGNDKSAQMSWAPLTSWDVPPFSLSDGPEDSYTLEHFENQDSQFQTIL